MKKWDTAFGLMFPALSSFGPGFMIMGSNYMSAEPLRLGVSLLGALGVSFALGGLYFLTMHQQRLINRLEEKLQADQRAT